MNRQARDRYWLAAALVLAAGLAVQSWRLEDASTRLMAAEARPYWPDRPGPLGIEQDRAPRFSPSMRKTIPDTFWGEFAEDIHDCGGEQTLLVKANELIRPGNERQTIEEVGWKTAQRIEVDVRDESGMRVSYGMLLSDDREEITFVYTNTKNVVQRCSARAHGSPQVFSVSRRHLHLQRDRGAGRQRHVE
jgi:hypothetical protein